MRLRSASLVLGSLIVLAACSNATPARFLDAPTIVHDDRFHALVAEDSRIEILAEDFGWAEGPVWATDLNALLFSDVAADRIFRWDSASGTRVYLSPSGHEPDDHGAQWRGSNGLAIDRNGTLLLAQQSNRTLSRMAAPVQDPAPDYDVLASEYDGRRLNSPNDLVVHRSGDIYFTDPPYGLAGFENSPDRELDFFGVFRLTEEGELSLVTGRIERPNGIALSAGHDTLYVSNSHEGKAELYAIDIDERGVPGQARRIFDGKDLIPNGPGTTDGLAVHPDGHLFVSIPNGVGLLSPQGRLLGQIALGQVTNMTLDPASAHLYITTPGRLLRLALESPSKQGSDHDGVLRRTTQ